MTHKRTNYLLFAIAVIAPLLCAQSQPTLHFQAVAFEAASVKPRVLKVGEEGSRRSRIEYSPVSLSMWNVELRDCVQWAYGAKYFQLDDLNSRHADSTEGERYDILAKTPRPVPVSQLRVMLEDLLAKRFKLAIHRETKNMPVLELVVGRGGAKLPAPKTDSERPGLRNVESLPQVRGDSFFFADTTLGEFAEKLGMLRSIDQPVVDRTGIAGIFDITLKSAAEANRHPDGVSLLTLVQEQLGLKMVGAKEPIEVFVMDHAERPSGN